MRWNEEPYIVSEGYPFIFVSAFLALFSATSDLHCLAWTLLVLTLAIAAFFRNPFRHLPDDPRYVVSPADGRILDIEKLDEESLIKEPCWKISIFMSPLDVHVNRMPASGKVTQKTHCPGHFYVASKPKASLENERVEMIMEADNGLSLGMVQIAGRLARRIVCYPREGDRMERGERFGLIRFGSRVELYLPLDITVSTKVGDRVKGGESIMGYFA